MKYATSLLWAAFAVFVACAIYFNWHENLFAAGGTMAGGKYLVWTAFAGFLAYTIYCSVRENLFSSIGQIKTLHWGRQVGLDLYIGLSLMLFFVYLNEGSWLVVLLWLPPFFAFGNIATLLYFAIHYDSIVARFLS